MRAPLYRVAALARVLLALALLAYFVSEVSHDVLTTAVAPAESSQSV